MTTPTLIAILDFSTSSAHRPTALAQLAREQPIVRSMPGCVGFRVFPSAEADTDITVVHEWTDQSAFADYLASEAFARSGEVLRPLMTAPPSSRRFRAELLETVA
jgi:quinol monooxygenase YgiN